MPVRALRGVYGPLVGLVVVVGCTDVELGVAESPVIGGQPTIEGKFPGVGALMYSFGGSTIAGCTGTLIAPNAVLTAAHCLDPELTGSTTPPGFTLALDTTVGNPVVVPGMAAHKHEMFTLDNIPGDGLGTFYDVGIVILAQPITDVPPLRMPRMADAVEILADLDLEIVGYGKTTVEGDATGIMYDARTKLVSLNDTELQVGMGSPQPQNCNGDSGGPAFATVGGVRRVIGVVSRSYAGFECTRGGVDTRVDAYLPWIHSKVPTGIPCSSGMAEPCIDDDDEAAGCCSTSTRGLPGSALLVTAVALLLGRRRR